MTRLSLRTRAWLACALLSLGLYAVRATHLPRRTPAGTEQRLFAGEYTVWHLPGSRGEWLVVPAEAAPAALPGNAAPLARLKAMLEAFTWPDETATHRRLTPFREEGTWQVGPLGLRRVWRYPTAEVDEAHRWLLTQERGMILDLADRRTYGGSAAEERAQELPSPYAMEDEEYDVFGKDPEELNSLALPLVGASTLPTKEEQVKVAGRRLTLLSGDPPTPRSMLFAISDHDAPRMLPLAEGAEPVRLSDDGRTLFFRRRGALWRLDLRKPLPELLDEAVPPPLPDVD